MSPKDGEGIANSVDPVQTADLGLHCLPRLSVQKLRIIEKVSSAYILGDKV